VNDNQCGPKSSCIEGFCGGLFACGDGELVSADALCDAALDCQNGADEDYVMCFGDAASFECADGTLVPATGVCNTTMDCEDGSDELASLCAGVGVNQCEGIDGDLGYTLGPTHGVSPAPAKLEVTHVMGSPAEDVIVAAIGGDQVRVVSFDTTDPLAEFYLNGPPPSFGNSTVVDVELGPVDDGDSLPDIVIATTGAEAGIYVFQNMGGMPPEVLGEASSLPDLPDAKIVGFELGMLDTDDTSDIVVIVDGETKGQLFVAVGDPAAAEMGGAAYGFVDQPSLTIGYDTFLDSQMVDIDGDGDDDLLVSGIAADNTGKLWVIERTGSDGALPIAWDTPETEMLMPMFFPEEIVVSRFSSTMAQGFDVALLDAHAGKIQTFLNMGESLAPGQLLTLTGSQFSGLAVADMNCDGAADYLYNVGSPAQVHVLLGSGMGGVAADWPDPLIYASGGAPSGGLAVINYDADSSPDIVAAVGAGEGVTQAEIRLLLTGDAGL
jgi:hypothetical protein